MTFFLKPVPIYKFFHHGSLMLSIGILYATLQICKCFNNFLRGAETNKCPNNSNTLCFNCNLEINFSHTFLDLHSNPFKETYRLLILQMRILHFREN